MRRRSTNSTILRLRSGYTLMEMVVASATSAVLIGGMASSLYIASQSLDVDQGSVGQKRQAQQVLAMISRDLQSAVGLTHLSSTSVTMTVPDRDGDAVPETIRYYWSGTPNESLFQEYNNGTAVAIAENVQAFSLAWATRFIEGVTAVPTLLLVTDEDGTLSAGESERQSLFESWGYTVTPLWDGADQETYDDALTDAIGVYVTSEVDATDVAYKLREATVGIVSEHPDLDNEFGFATNNGSGDENTTVSLINVTHPITTGYATGSQTVYTDWNRITYFSGTKAGGLQVLGQEFGVDSFAVLDEGATLANIHNSNSTAAGRRVRMWFGDSSFVFSELDSTGQDLLQKSVDWAINGGDADATGVTYEEFTEAQVGSNTTSITISTPSGTSEDDLLIAVVATDGNKSTSLSAPSGWNQIIVASESDDRVTLGVWWKLAGSSEPSNRTFSWSGNEKAYGWMMRFTGHNTANPIHATATSEGDNDTPSAPSVTTTVDECLIVRIGGFDDDDHTNGDAGMAGHTTITSNESDSSSSSCSGAAAYVKQDSAGTTGSASFSLNNNEEWRTLTIAIEPDPDP